jgi:hypothetical protein
MRTTNPSHRDPTRPQEPDPTRRDTSPNTQRALPFSSEVTEKLRNLHPGQSLYVGTGETAETKEKRENLISGREKPTATFEKTKEGFTVFSGMPPLNSTYCGSGPIPSSGELLNAPPMRHPVILNSGDWLALTPAFSFQLPTSRLTAPPQTPHEIIASKLLEAPVGSTLTVGRSSALQLPGSVSRNHITVTILKRNENIETGAVEIRLRVVPGKPSEYPTLRIHDDGRTEEIHGSAKLGGGASVRFGESGTTVTLPHPPHSPKSVSQDIHESILGNDMRSARESLKTYVGKANLGEFSEDVREKQRLSLKDPEKLVKGNLLQNHIRMALVMIREGHTDEAVAHLTNQSILNFLGYTLEENNVCQLRSLDKDSVKSNLIDVASRSWFKPREKLVYPSVGWVSKELADREKTPDEVALLERWKKELALIYAEEYTHALQHYLEEPVSRKATFAIGSSKNFDFEADVALFFFEQGVNLSYEFIENRYSSRAHAIKRALGSQTPEQQAMLTEQVLSTPINKWATLLGSVKILRNDFGTYNLDLAPLKTPVYVPDPSGYYSRMTGALELSAGTPIYIGTFRFELP